MRKSLMPEPQHKKKDSGNRKVGGYSAVLKYTGLAFQMIAVVLLFTYAGYKIDEWLGLTVPIFMIIFIIAGLFGYLYKLIKSL
ncbi:AtpZ/AtpI family protein [bacterium]|nr:AtpZ/AtpI family protein [bacterium]